MMKYTIKKFLMFPKTLKIKYYKWFNRLYFQYKKIKFGKNLQVYNKVYITGKLGKITIGDNFTFTSGDGINPICRNIRGCFHTNDTNTIIQIGNNVGISSSCIRIKEKLTIGNHVNIGGNCIIMDTDVHQLDYRARRGEKVANEDDANTMVQSAPIIIEDDVWIGANSIVMKGVTIGAHSIIGAGSVVAKSIPSDCIAVGNPCRVIRYLNKVNENH